MDDGGAVDAAFAEVVDVAWLASVDDVNALRAVVAECVASRATASAVAAAAIARLVALGQTYTEITAHCGVPRSTAQRWKRDHETTKGEQ